MHTTGMIAVSSMAAVEGHFEWFMGYIDARTARRGQHRLHCGEYRWENNFSLPGKSDGKREKERGRGGGGRRTTIGREGERTGNRDSTRSIPGLRVRLVKSFAGIMNPPRVVIPTFVLAGVTTRRLFAATKTKGVGAS